MAYANANASASTSVDVSTDFSTTTGAHVGTVACASASTDTSTAGDWGGSAFASSVDHFAQVLSLNPAAPHWLQTPPERDNEQTPRRER